MNPLNWKHEHQVALGIAAVIGAVLGVLTGYLVYAVPSGMWLEFGVARSPVT
jgi:high-affinity Fe2+/Pb2+ permease